MAQKKKKDTYSPADGTYSTMTGTQGHFEKGKWIEDAEPVQEPGLENESRGNGKKQETVDTQIQNARNSVQKAIQDVLNAGRIIFTTIEGHKHVDEVFEKASSQIEKAFSDIVSYAENTIKKNK